MIESEYSSFGQVISGPPERPEPPRVEMRADFLTDAEAEQLFRTGAAGLALADRHGFPKHRSDYSLILPPRRMQGGGVTQRAHRSRAAVAAWLAERAELARVLR